MGPENSNGPFVAYIDGQPVEIGQPMPEITADYSAGGISAEDAAAAMATASKAWADVSITMEVAAEGIREFFSAMELASTYGWRGFLSRKWSTAMSTQRKRGAARNTKSGSGPGFGRCWGKCSV